MKKSTKWRILGGAILGFAGFLGIWFVDDHGYKNGVLDFERILKEYDPEWYEDFKDSVRMPYSLD